MPNDFAIDDKWQREVRERILAPGFYGAYAVEGRYVFIDKGRLASMLQRRYAVDTIMQGRNGHAICIEEKIVRWPIWDRPHTSFAIETKSCTVAGHESDGWAVYGKADFLLYAFAQPNESLNVYVVDFPKLQAWFWPREDEFATFGPLKTLNRTMGRKVPIRRVELEVGFRLAINVTAPEAQ